MNSSDSSPNDPLSRDQPYRSPTELSEQLGRPKWLTAVIVLGLVAVATMAGAFWLFLPNATPEISDFGAWRSPPPPRVETVEYEQAMKPANPESSKYTADETTVAP